MVTRLCYNDTDRMYEVRLGLRVLSSHPTKEQAELALLSGEAPKALELAQTLITAHPELAARGEGAVEIFWAAICMGYAEVLEGLLDPLPLETRRIVIDLLRSSFNEPAAPAETTEP